MSFFRKSVDKSLNLGYPYSFIPYASKISCRTALSNFKSFLKKLELKKRNLLLKFKELKNLLSKMS